MDPTDAGEPQDTVWTAEACLTAFQAANEQYWNDHGLSMAHPPPTSPAPTAAQVVPLGAPSSSAVSGGWNDAAPLATLTHSWRLQSQPQPQVRPFELLPQREYVAKRRFEPKPPIIFRTWTQPYVRLADAFAGNVTLLQGRDEAVFSGDHLSQKQSLRLEVCASATSRSARSARNSRADASGAFGQIVGCRSYERQINVRTPANSFRSITKAKLAEKIAREIFDYMNVSAASHADGSPHGADGCASAIRACLLDTRASTWARGPRDLRGSCSRSCGMFRSRVGNPC